MNAVCFMYRRRRQMSRNVQHRRPKIQSIMIKIASMIDELSRNSDMINNIDNICNRDEVYNLAEKCANTGFGILKEYTEHLDEEALFYKLIGYMDKKYEEIKDELSTIITGSNM